MGRGVSIVRGVIPVLLLVLTGCVAEAGGPSPTEPHGHTTTTTLPTTTTTLTLEEGLAGYRNCLSERGVSIGEIPLDGLGRPRMATALTDVDLNDRTVLDALDACGHHLASGALDSSSDPELRALVEATLQDFAECVRKEGVIDYPDPAPGFDGVGSPFPVNRIPWTDPDLPAAVTVCSAGLETPAR